MKRWIIAFALVSTLFARPARADLASSLYGDVRDVIEELIQTEVTTSVVTTIKGKSPALAFYMHGTLERLASPYWGSLGRVMKDDLTVAVADFVYWHLSTGGGDGDIVASAKAFFGCAKATTGVPTPACKRLLDAIDVQHRPLLEVECRRAKPGADRRIACHVGLAVLAALQGRGEVRHHLVDALSDIVLLEIADKDVGARMRDVLTKWLDLPKDLPTPLIEALGNPDLGADLTDEAIEKLCADPKTIQDALADPLAPRAWICFAVTHPALPKLLAATVVVKEKGKSINHTIDYWVIEPAVASVDADRADDDSILRAFAELAFDADCPAGKDYQANTWPCTGKRLEPGAEISVTWQGRPLLTASVGAGGKIAGGGKVLLGPLLKFRKLMRRIRELQALVPPSLSAMLFHAGTTVSPDAKSALRAAHRMARLVTELRARWYLWSQSSSPKGIEELDVAELLHVARDSLDDLNVGSSALAFLDKHSSGASTLDIGDWLRLVMRQDYRSLAMESLRAALAIEMKNQNRPHETFFLSLAAYLLDDTDGVGENVARAAFRASAKELLLSASHKGVPRVGDRWRFRVLPRLGLGLSFNDSYAPTDGDNRRYVVTANWPTAMFGFNDYFGLEVSAIDPVAPLAEMALRPPGEYARYTYVALDALRPRLGGWIAMPQLSRRLALTAGFGARFLNVTREDDGSDPKKLSARYGYKASLTFDAGIEFVF